MLLIFPPQWTPISPHYAICALMGQLKNAGYNAKFMDLNVEFYKKILTKDYLQFIQTKIQKDYVTLFLNIKKIYDKNKKESKYTLDEKAKLYKFNKMKQFVSKGDTYYNMVPDLIPLALNVIKDEDRFYTPEHLVYALKAVDCALEMVSLAYAPNNIGFEYCHNPLMEYNFESIKHFVFDSESNIFWQFYSKKNEEIKAQKPSLVAISLNSSSQIIAGLTLAYLVKKHTKAHVNIGGNFFGRIKEALIKRPEFSIFCDSISIEEGEGPILELAKFINGEIKIDKVPNLIYFKNKKAFENEKMCPIRLNDMANVNLDDCNLDDYFTPKIVMPYQTSRGCYWGKCTFCDQDFGMEYNVKDIKKVINEFKELKEKYNVDCFEFIDESVSPVYLKELSKQILDNNLKTSFFIDARLENQFDNEVFKIASKAGLKMIMWGVESGSKKIMDSINKGVDFNKRFDILKMANKNNIWNFAFIFFGYPLETQDDARETIKMLCDNHEIINSYGRSIFTMGRHAKIAQEPDKFGITKLYEAKDEFSPNIEFDCIGMNKEQMNQIIAECMEQCRKYYQDPLLMYLRYREWLFLYIKKHGLEWVKKHKLKLGE
ncbi:MAG: radical SAM protein [Candidatus Gastranaerophilales bacterium]|nr:radical SAM protein [Candidatus Gastranaerophilales bacterium]